jgi:adenine-specific DNA-methyltransferase
VHPGKDDWLILRSPCVLLQRTTSKEQRRLIASELPASFLEEHGAAVVENRLNMIYPAEGPLIPTRVSPRAIAALFNSQVVDELFRCINGSVAVSAFELEALPLPPPEALEPLEQLLEAGATPDEIDAHLRAAYRDEVAAAA